MTKSNLFGNEWDGLWRDFDYMFKDFPHRKSHQVGYVGEEHSDRLELSIDMPGVTKDEVKLSFEEKVLSIKAKNDKRDYDQSYRVSQDIQANKITAKIENGILTVILPKTEASKPTDIKVD